MVKGSRFRVENGNRQDQGDRNFHTPVYVPEMCINEGL